MRSVGNIVVFSISSLTQFIRYIYQWNLQLLNNVIIMKTKVVLIWAILFRLFWNYSQIF